jgi:hypothetical protein
MDGVAGGDFDAEMVEGATTAGVCQEHKLEGRFDDCEVGIAGFHFGWLRVEQFGVERDCLVEVVDVEGQLNTRHGDSFLGDAGFRSG